jgi:hypothetical protein
MLQVLVLCVAVAAVTPKLKWGQDKDFLYVKVAGTKCGGNGVSLDSGAFKLSCGKHELDLSLREDLDVDASICKSTRNGEECKLKKQHSHLFDRLTAQEDGLQGFGTVDFDHWEEEKEEEAAADPMAALGGMAGMGGMGGMGGMDMASMMGGMGGMGGGKGKSAKPSNTYEPLSVPKLTEADIDTHTKNGKTVLAHAFYPWCAECDKHQDGFSVVASQEKDNYVFGWVDLREERALSRKLNLGCDASCTLQLFATDSNKPTAVPIDSAAGTDAMRKAVLAFSFPVVSTFADAKEMDAFSAAALEQGRSTAIGFFADQSDSNYADFQASASELRSTVAFGAAFGEDLAGKRGKLPWLLVGPDLAGVDYGAVQEKGTATYISKELLPAMQKYSHDIGAKYDAFNLPTLQVFVDDSDATFDTSPFEEAAQTLKGLGLPVVVNTKSDHSYRLESFGFDKDGTYPKAGVQATFDYESETYPFESESHSADALIAFGRSFLAGGVPPFRKSEAPAEKEWARGTLKKIVFSSFDADLVNNQEDVLVVVSKPWAGNEQKLSTASQRIANLLKGVEGVTVATYDSDKNFAHNDVFDVKDTEYDGILFFKAVGKPVMRFKGKVKQVLIRGAEYEELHHCSIIHTPMHHCSIIHTPMHHCSIIHTPIHHCSIIHTPMRLHALTHSLSLSHRPTC